MARAAAVGRKRRRQGRSWWRGRRRLRRCLFVEDREVVAPPRSLAIGDSTALGLEPRCNRTLSMAVLLRAALNAAPQLQRPLLWKIQRLLLPVLHGGRPRRQDVVGRRPRITCEQQQASARQHESHGFKRPWQPGAPFEERPSRTHCRCRWAEELTL